jgi:hypothetical protein
MMLAPPSTKRYLTICTCPFTAAVCLGERVCVCVNVCVYDTVRVCVCVQYHLGCVSMRYMQVCMCISTAEEWSIPFLAGRFNTGA